MPVRAFCAMPPGYITYATAGAIRDKIRNGEPFDSPQESVVGPTLPSPPSSSDSGYRGISCRPAQAAATRSEGQALSTK